MLQRHARGGQGRELSRALQFDEHGIPCHVILDADGTPLATSIGPRGNIGFPGENREGAAHMRMMLAKTARALSEPEIDALIESLSER